MAVTSRRETTQSFSFVPSLPPPATFPGCSAAGGAWEEEGVALPLDHIFEAATGAAAAQKGERKHQPEPEQQQQ